MAVSSSRRWLPAAAGAAIVVLTLLAYLPALQGGFVWDDDTWTTKMDLHDAAGLGTIWSEPTALQQYYPLTATSFWVDYQLWTFSPLPFHVENVLLHALAALLFWRILERLKVQGAWLAAVIFALHPVMVESAGWITERKNVLSLALCLAALLAYLRHLDSKSAEVRAAATAGPRDGVIGRIATPYVLAWFLFVGALLAKPTVFALPAIILLLLWWKRGELRWRADVLPTLPFFVPALGMCALTAWLEKNHAGAQGVDFVLTFTQRFLIAGRSFWFYLGKLAWPSGLSFIYPRWQPNAGQWWQWLYPIAGVSVVIGLWLARRRIGRGPATAAFFYAGTLFPLLGFVNVYFMRYSFVCDHWAYLPSLGPIALAASGLTATWRNYRGDGRRFLEPAFVVALVLTLGTLTWRQAGMYEDLETLWRVTITRNPGSWMAHNSLGNVLVRTGRADSAISEYEEAIRLKPDLAEAYTSLGVTFAQKGRIAEAMAQFMEAVRVRPDYAEGHYDLGLALAMKGRVDEAIGQFREAIRLKPNFAAAHTSLAKTLAAKDRMLRARP